MRECAAVSGAGCVHPLPVHTQMSAKLLILMFTIFCLRS